MIIKPVAVLCQLTIQFSLADEFEKFLKQFFQTIELQIEHVKFPINGSYTYVCDGDKDGTCEKDTVFASSPKRWEYIGYGYGTHPGVTYRLQKNALH